MATSRSQETRPIHCHISGARGLGHATTDVTKLCEVAENCRYGEAGFSLEIRAVKVVAYELEMVRTTGE